MGKADRKHREDFVMIETKYIFPKQLQSVAKFINAQNLGYLSEFSQNLSTQKSAAEFESTMNEFLNARNLELKHIAQALRIALTGSSVSPGIYEVLEFLGTNECKERIASFLNAMKGK